MASVVAEAKLHLGLVHLRGRGRQPPRTARRKRKAISPRGLARRAFSSLFRVRLVRVRCSPRGPRRQRRPVVKLAGSRRPAAAPPSTRHRVDRRRLVDRADQGGDMSADPVSKKVVRDSTAAAPAAALPPRSAPGRAFAQAFRRVEGLLDRSAGRRARRGRRTATARRRARGGPARRLEHPLDLRARPGCRGRRRAGCAAHEGRR